MEMVWNIPNESQILDRIDELSQAIENFPESKLVPVWQHAIEDLEAKLNYSNVELRAKSNI